MSPQYRDSNSHKLWIFRRQNKGEKYALENIQSKSKGGNVSQLIWECFVSENLHPIAFIYRMVKTQVYIDMLANVFLPFIDVLNIDDITDIVIQQDNAHPHVVKKQ